MLGAVFVLATPVHFVAQTVLADEFPAPIMTAIIAMAVAVLAVLVSGLPKAAELRELSVRDGTLLVVAGLLGIFGTQYLVLSHRFTDAPPGAEVIFFTTATWGMVALLASLATRRKPSSLQLVAGAIALVGAAAILANWERPSSFSPLSRYPVQDAAMLLAGVAWAAFGGIVANVSARRPRRVMMLLLTAPSAVVAAIVAALSPGSALALQRVSMFWPLLFVLCVAFTSMVVAWAWLSSLVGIARAASSLFAAPVILTVLAILERRAGSAGPSPLLWEAVSWGSAIVLAGILGVAAFDRDWLGGRSGPRLGPRAEPGQRSRRTAAHRWMVLALITVAALATLAGALALAASALEAHVVGERTGGAGYDVTWRLPGAETVGAWLAFLCGLALLAAGLQILRFSWRTAAAAGAAVGVAVVLMAVPALEDTPLRTWTRWIPAEVQQDYGTEYASLTFDDEPRTAVDASARLGFVGAALLLLVGVTGMSERDRRGRTESRSAMSIEALDEAKVASIEDAGSQLETDE